MWCSLKNAVHSLLRQPIRLLGVSSVIGAANGLFCTHPDFPVYPKKYEKTTTQIKQERAQHYFIKGRDYERRGLNPMALHYYEQARELDPESNILNDIVLTRYIVSDKTEKALSFLTSLAEKRSLTDKEKRVLYRIYLRMGDHTKASVILESIDPKTDAEQALLGFLYETSGRVKKALDVYTTFLATHPDSVRIALKIGELFVRDSSFAAAESLFSDQAARHPENPDVQTSLGTFHLLNNDTAKARACFQRALALDSLSLTALHHLGRLYLQNNDYDHAIAIYSKLYHQKPFHEYGKTLAMLYYYSDAYDSAASLLQSMLIENLEDYELHFLLGLVFRAREEPAQARIEFEKALALQPAYKDAWRNLCYLELQDSLSGDAMTCAKRFVKAMPDVSVSWRMLGYVYAQNKEFTKTVAILDTALARDSTDVDAWFELGSALERLSRIQEAAGAFHVVLDLKPGDAAAANYLGYMWAEQEVHLDSAKKLLEIALAQEPQNGAYLDSYAWVFFKQGQLDSAHAYIRKALDTINSDPVIFEHLGDIQYARELYHKAVEAYKKALSLQPDSTTAATLREKIRKAEEKSNAHTSH